MAFSEQYEVVVVGAGHAGCEAAMAAARMGLKTALITMNMDLIAQMSCNPAIGGVAKGHLVREVDALGGIMGEVADAVGIQFRLLNTSRGPAVWSPRAQCDKQLYRVKMREVLESQAGLHIRQAEVVDLVLDEIEGSGVRDQGSEKPLIRLHPQSLILSKIPKIIFPTSCDRPSDSSSNFESPFSRARTISSCVCSSKFEPLAIPKNCLYSPLFSLPCPSAMLLGTETAERRIWLVRP